MRAFLGAVESSEAQMTWTQGQVQDAIDAYGQTQSEQAQRELIDNLQSIAAEGRDRIKAAGDEVAAVDVSPWHGDLLRAKQAYLEHNAAWQEYLDRASRDASEFGRPQDRVDSTFAAAEPLFRQAVPIPDAYGTKQRVDVIFAEPVTQGGPTQEARLAA